MSQDLQTRLLALERSARRWKVLALSTWVLLAVVLVVGFRTMHIMVERERLRAEEAQQQNERHLQQVQHAQEIVDQMLQDAPAENKEADQQLRQQLQKRMLRALEAAEQAEKKARQQSMREMYHSQILLAQQAWHKADLRPSNKP